MKISALIQGLSIAAVLLVAGSPAYGASFYITTPGTQLDDDPILDIAGRPGGTINWSGFIETTGLTANLQSITLFAEPVSNEITGTNPERADDAQFLPNVSRQVNVDPNTGLNTILAVFSGPPGLPPNFNYKVNDVTATLGSQLNNDGEADFRFGVSSAIDVNGRDVTDQFTFVSQEFEVQPVPEPSSVFGLVLAGGFGVFLRRKRNKKVQY
jgi:hypothetical protein